MIPTILALAIAGAPAPILEKTGPAAPALLAAYILKINPKAHHATRLAQLIIRESRRHKVDPAYLAAIAHTESHFRTTARGQWYERGIWQIWPWAGYWAGAWYSYQAAKFGKTGFPAVAWVALGRKLQIKASLDLEVATYLAAHLAAWHVGKCGRHSARCYARYNSGGPRVRRGYVWALTRRARAIRRVLRGR